MDLLGHQRFAGRVTSVDEFGTTMGRMEVYGQDEQLAYTMLFHGTSIYRLIYCGEAEVMEVARRTWNPPVTLFHAIPETEVPTRIPLRTRLMPREQPWPADSVIDDDEDTGEDEDEDDEPITPVSTGTQETVTPVTPASTVDFDDIPF